LFAFGGNEQAANLAKQLQPGAIHLCAEPVYYGTAQAIQRDFTVLTATGKDFKDNKSQGDTKSTALALVNPSDGAPYCGISLM
jgi:hypothetical protein